MIKKRNKKGGFEVTTSQLIGFLIAALILGIFLVGYFFGLDWAKEAIEFARNILRWGR